MQINIFILSILCLYLTSSSISFNNEYYLIDTPNCKIPLISAYSADLNLTRSSSSIKCSNFSTPLSYTKNENNSIWLHINSEAIRNYFGSGNNLKCCYSYVYRNGNEEFPDVGVGASYCHIFNSPLKLMHNLIWISCSSAENFIFNDRGFPRDPYYQNVHQTITINKQVKENNKKLVGFEENKRPISVLMIVIDSVSRLNFIRTMPITRNYIMENGFYEFVGYNKIGDNTYPNAMAFLTGLNLNDSMRICRPTEVDGLINCPFIWKNYQNSGYTTAYAEDWSSIATFNYLKKGFKNPPTDYYFKPYMDAITYLETQVQDTMPFCSGPESQGDRVLNLAKDFANTFKKFPSFGVFWMNTFSHNYITTPMTMDSNVKEFMEDLKKFGILDESIVILLSDHGIRFGDIINTTRGFYELRLPMNYISLPSRFKLQYPNKVKNFEENTKKLTSNYDIYMTLQDILQLSVKNYTQIPAMACPSCISLFEKIPDIRNCSAAGIPEIWCTCNSNYTQRETF